MRSRGARLAVGGLVAAGLMALVLWGQDWAALGSAFQRARWSYLAAMALLTVVMYAARAWRWRYLLQPLADVPLRQAFSATAVGFMAGLAVPRAQEVLRPYLVARRHSLRTAAAFASIIVERLLDLITVLILFGLHLFVFSDRAARAGQPLMGAVEKGGALAALGALGVLAVLVAFHWRAEALLALAERLLGRLPARLAGPFLGLLRSFGEGLAIFKASPLHLLAIAGQSLLVWLLIAASLQLANLAFDVHLPFHATFLMLGFLTVGVAVPTPGMVGGFHAAYVVALGVFGVPRETATAAAVAAHALSNLPVLLMGLACLPGEGLTLGGVATLTEEKAA